MKNNKKGFTLAELLIVIAIIAVLVGIMFPVFGGATKKAKHAACVANVRANLAELVSAEMLKDGFDGEVELSLDDLKKNATDCAVAKDTNGIKVTLDSYEAVIPVDSDVKVN